MAMDAIIHASVFPRSADRKPLRRKHEMLEVLVSGLAATSRTTQVHAIRMLEQVPDLKREEEQPLIFCIIRGTSLTIFIAADLFSQTSISVISNIIVYEYDSRDSRLAGLTILENLQNISKKIIPKVTTALLASVKFGFNNGPRLCLHTIQFLRAIAADTDSKRLLRLD
jgi:hypothetical protein